MKTSLLKDTSGREESLLQDVDEALNEDRMGRKEKEPPFVDKLKSLPGVLRTVGALVLVASAATFLLQGWDEMSHIVRYFSFLVFTLTLACAGFFCGLRIKEDKGARTFLAVTAAVIPVHFCQLGALIYSTVARVTNIPALLHWVAPSTFAALGTAAIGLVVLAPITLLAFAALARSKAKPLAVAYLLSNALLLIPTRTPGLVGLLALGGFVVIAMFERSMLRGDSALRTREGVLVRTLLYVPIMLMIGRSLNLYDVDQIFVGMVNAMAAIGMFRFVPAEIEDRKNAEFVQGLSVIPAGISYYLLSGQLITMLGLGAEYTIPVQYLPFSVVLFCMSLASYGTGSSYRKAASLFAIGVVILQLLNFPGILASTLCVVVGMLATAYGYTLEEKATFFFGVVGLAAGLGYHLHFALELVTFMPWVSLAVAGIATVVASSYVERNSRKIVEAVLKFKGQLATWK